MATLVLTAVGGVLGGRAGAMLGALAGRAADGAILGGGRRREGPRLTELAVQTSSYGTQVPRVWGRMRVAGTVFWATDLKEARSVSRGAKGQPATASYSYSCSFAVLLAARPILRVERIWADGRLLRGAAGDMKVQGLFRLHAGTEDQLPDPLIAGAEGMGRTPAARGHAYAVFENLALAEFGNRVPQMTFELVADEGPVAAGAVIAGVAPEADADMGLSLDGFAATGGSVRAVVELLAQVAGAPAAARDGRLLLRDRAGLAALEPAVLADGWSGGEQARRTAASADTVPRVVTVLHHDPARDYQAGLQRAARPGPGWREERVEVPAAMSPAAAKGVAAALLARAEAGRVRRTVRPGLIGLAVAPGDPVRVDGEPGLWRVGAVATEGLAAAVELVPLEAIGAAGPADGGRAATIPDRAVGRTVLHLFEVPPGGDVALAGPRLVAAAAGGPGWKGAGLLLSLDGGADWQDAGAIGRAATMGVATEALRAAPAALRDRASAVTVALLHAELALSDADAAGLGGGANLALIGEELVQFARAEPLGGGRWHLSDLLRGRRGTAPAGCAAGARFVLLDADAVRFLDLPLTALGRTARVLASGPGDGDGDGDGDGEGPAAAEAAVAGVSILPPAPVHLRWVPRDEGGRFRWNRRTRAGGAWLDGTDAALAEEREAYAVRLLRGDTVLREAELTAPFLDVTAAERAGGRLRLEVRQRGTAGLSALASAEA